MRYFCTKSARVRYHQRRDALYFHGLRLSSEGKAEREGESGWSALAAHALLLLADLDPEELDGRMVPSPSWLKPAVRTLMSLAAERERLRLHDMHYKQPPDHWYLEAAGELLSEGRPYLNQTLLPEWYTFTDHWESSVWTVPHIRQHVAEHAAQLVHAILTDYELLPRTHHEKEAALYGSLTLHGEAMLTAQRLRGLLAALLFLPPIRPLAFFTGETDRDRARATAMLRERVERIARRAGEYLATLQVTHVSNPMRGAFMRARSKMHVKLTLEAQDFDDRLNEVRMDVVADVLSALIRTRRLVLSHGR